MELAVENTIANMTYKKYLEIMKKTGSDSLMMKFKLMMADINNTQNWDLLHLKLTVFQRSRSAG